MRSPDDIPVLLPLSFPWNHAGHSCPAHGASLLNDKTPAQTLGGPVHVRKGGGSTPVCVTSAGTEATFVMLITCDLRAWLNSLPS